MRLRRAGPDDVDGICAVRRSLRFIDGDDLAGGFLLGSDPATYRSHVAAGGVWVLDDDGAVAGFTVVLDDARFRASDVWSRRDAVRWHGFDPADVEGLRAVYFDQLGVARGRHHARKWAPALALAALQDLAYDVVFATTVVAPVVNVAAVPYLLRVGGRRVGRIDEVYPDFGPLVSDVWCVTRSDVEARLRAPVGLAERFWLDAARAASLHHGHRQRVGDVLEDRDQAGG